MPVTTAVGWFSASRVDRGGHSVGRALIDSGTFLEAWRAGLISAIYCRELLGGHLDASSDENRQVFWVRLADKV